MILVYVETAEGRVSRNSLCAISAAQKLQKAISAGPPVALLVGGAEVKEAAEKVSAYGVSEVRYISHPQLEHIVSSALARVIIEQSRELSATHVLAAATSIGKDCLPRVACELEAGQASDVTAIVSASRFLRPMYAGNIVAEVEILSPVRVVTVRSSAFEPAAATEQAAPVRAIEYSAPASHEEFISFSTVHSERPELSEAAIVVSGGRGLRSLENFQNVLAPLADALGAAVGASRAAVDSGYAPNDWQVGQTGKIVAPDLYIAVGISGAIQHLAGMKDAKHIVAINNDADAPIFEIADTGLVADLFDVVPQLTEKIQKLKSS